MPNMWTGTGSSTSEYSGMDWYHLESTIRKLQTDLREIRKELDRCRAVIANLLALNNEVEAENCDLKRAMRDLLAENPTRK